MYLFDVGRPDLSVLLLSQNTRGGFNLEQYINSSFIITQMQKQQTIVHEDVASINDKTRNSVCSLHYQVSDSYMYRFHKVLSLRPVYQTNLLGNM